ncbi:MAG: hypothetical protein V1754_12985 [Pseudomonadota bacterium]
MNRVLRSILLLLLIGSVLLIGGTAFLFGTKNAHWVVVWVPILNWNWSNPLHFIDYELRLFAVMTGSFFAGVLLVGIFFVPSWIRRGVLRRRDRQFINGLEAEIADLRNLPIEYPAPFEDFETKRSGKKTPNDDSDEDENALIKTLEGLEPRP